MSAPKVTSRMSFAGLVLASALVVGAPLALDRIGGDSVSARANEPGSSDGDPGSSSTSTPPTSDQRPRDDRRLVPESIPARGSIIEPAQPVPAKPADAPFKPVGEEAGSPVRWDSCTPIRYVVRRQAGPEHGFEMVQELCSERPMRAAFGSSSRGSPTNFSTIGRLIRARRVPLTCGSVGRSTTRCRGWARRRRTPTSPVWADRPGSRATLASSAARLCCELTRRWTIASALARPTATCCCTRSDTWSGSITPTRQPTSCTRRRAPTPQSRGVQATLPASTRLAARSPASERRRASPHPTSHQASVGSLASRRSGHTRRSLGSTSAGSCPMRNPSAVVSQ
jgi:hypothetical protein